MTYKRNNSYLIFRIALTHLFPLVVYLHIGNKFFLVFIVWFITVFYYNVLSIFILKSLYKIEITEEHLKISYYRFFRVNIQKFDNFRLEYSFEYHNVGKGIKAKEIRIHYKNQLLVQGIGRAFDGWPADVLDEIAEELKKSGIKQITMI